jgi:hypothetical protein
MSLVYLFASEMQTVNPLVKFGCDPVSRIVCTVQGRPKNHANLIVRTCASTITAIQVDGSCVLPAKQFHENTITVLDLSSKGLGVDGVLVLTALMSVNTSLQQLHLFSNKMGADGGKTLADAIRAHPNYTRIAMNMFQGKTDVNLSNAGLDSGDAFLIAAALEKNDKVTRLNVSSNSSMGANAAKVFGEMLLLNTTLQTLNMSNIGLGKIHAGDQVKLKSSGVMKVATAVRDGNVQFSGCDRLPDLTTGGYFIKGYVKASAFEWESNVPALCAGVAGSKSLTSVSK